MIAARRLLNQRISRPDFRRPADVVRWLGAVQAQEFPWAKWALGLRMAAGHHDSDVQRAFDRGEILRTHVMRPTWHFVAAEDLGWLLALTAPRVHRAMSSYMRHLELDSRLLTRATAVIERALRDGAFLTRSELGSALARARIDVKGMRLAMVAMYAELEAVICSGPRRDKHFTYALFADRAPRPRRLSGDEALAELAGRYFSSHGPATLRDFVWWSGLKTADARRGVEMAGARPTLIDGLTYWSVGAAARPVAERARVHLLPIYDEFTVAYRDREAVPHGGAVLGTRSRGTVTFQHALIVAGKIAGTWKARTEPAGVGLDVFTFEPLRTSARAGLEQAAARLGAFLDRPVSVRVIS